MEKITFTAFVLGALVGTLMAGLQVVSEANATMQGVALNKISLHSE